jgi:hypothetical protein
VPIFYVEHGGKHDRKKTHCENQNKVQYLVLSFLALPVTHLRTNPYRTPSIKGTDSSVPFSPYHGKRSVALGSEVQWNGKGS